MADWPTDAEKLETCKRQLHDALGLSPEDYNDFSWHELLTIVQKDYQILRNIRRALEDLPQ